MKLGATITSERGKPVTKTGNEYLFIDILANNGEKMFDVKITVGEIIDGMQEYLIQTTGAIECENTYSQRINGSLKQGKGLQCTYCGNKTQSKIETGNNNVGGTYKYCTNCKQNF